MDWINDQLECLKILEERLKVIYNENNEKEKEGIERAIREIKKYKFELCLRGIESIKRRF